MKSLKESLFDSDLVTKDITFSDIFELDEYESSKSLHSPLSQEFSVQRLKRLIKVPGSDNDEIIYNGIVELIKNIKIDKDPDSVDKKWLRYEIQEFGWDLFRKPSYASLYIGFSKNGRLLIGQDGLSLFDQDFNTIQIRLGTNLNLIFRRK